MSIGGGRLFWKGSTLRLVPSVKITAPVKTRSTRTHSVSLFLVFALALAQIACGDIASRAAKAVGAIPSVVRVLFPNADSRILDAVDAAGRAFKDFVDNKTGSNWQRAEQAWNAAKPLLARLGNARIQQIIAVVDILLSQVSVPSGPMAEAAGDKVVVQFNERDVKRLEELVK